MSDPLAFLRARLDEVELLAREATPGPWTPEEPLLTDVVTSALLGRVADCSVGTGYRPQSLPDARHIVLHDPAAVLRRITADREILEDAENVLVGWHYEETKEFAQTVIRILAEGWGWTAD